MNEQPAIQPTSQIVTAAPLIPTERVENKYGHTISYCLPHEMAADADYWKSFWIAPVEVELISLTVYWSNANNIAGTLQLENLNPGSNAGSGSDILKTAINLNAASPVESPTLQPDMNEFRVIQKGHRLGITVNSGALQDLRDLQLTIYYKPLARGGYR